MPIEEAVGSAAGTSAATAQGTTRPQGTVTAARAAFVQEEFRSVVWQSTPIKDAYGKVARDTKDNPIPTFFDNMEDCYIIAQERGRIIGSHARRFRVVVDRIITEAELGFATTLPGARLIDTELAADMDVAVAALESVDFNSEQTVLQVWGRIGPLDVNGVPVPPTTDHRIRSSRGASAGYSSAYATAESGAPAVSTSAGSSTAAAVSVAILEGVGSASGASTGDAPAEDLGQPAYILTSGDMQSGTDRILLSGDMQNDGDDLLLQAGYAAAPESSNSGAGNAAGVGTATGTGEVVATGVGNAGGFGIATAVSDSGYSETGTLGVTTGTTQYASSPNEKTVIPVTVPAGGVWAKRLVLGVHTGVDTDSVRAIVYAGATVATSTLSKAGVDTAVINGSGTMDLWFNADQSAVFFPAGDYWIGAHGSGGSDWRQISDGGVPSKYTAADAFAGGSDATFGSASDYASRIVVSMPYSLSS